uniref:Condensation domain-containing protein n=1 Tax=Chryseobacterium sp. B5 TaxID=2050562 RepID=A0A2G7T5I5_9FLAO
MGSPCRFWSRSCLRCTWRACRRPRLPRALEPRPWPPPLCYADYAAWQRRWMGSAEHARQLRYWQDQLGGEHPLLQLPVDHPRRADGRYEAGEWQFELPDTLARQLHAVARAQGTTLFTVLLTGLQILLYRYSGQQDIRVGVPIANRHRPGAEGIVGLLVNTQVLRGQVHDGLTLDEALARAARPSAGRWPTRTCLSSNWWRCFSRSGNWARMRCSRSCTTISVRRRWRRPALCPAWWWRTPQAVRGRRSSNWHWTARSWWTAAST